MKKKIFTLLTLAVLGIGSAWAQTTQTISWTDMATSGHNANKAGAATSTNLTPATGVVTELSTNGTVTKDFGGGETTYYRYKGFAVEEDTEKYFEYSFSVASGYAFTPSKISVGWAPNGGKAVCFNVYVGTSSSNLVKIGTLIHSADNTYSVDDITNFTALGTNTKFTMIRLVPYGKASSIILNSVEIQGSLVTDTKTSVTLSFETNSGSADVADGATLPALSSDPNVTAITSNITYSSSNTSVATVNPTTGALTLKNFGTTIITASFAGDATYRAAEATYTLTVTDRTLIGYVEPVDDVLKTLGARELLTGLSHVSLTLTHGSKITDYASRSKEVYNAGTVYTNTNSWSKDAKDTYENEYVGYNITIEDGYMLDLSKLDAVVWVNENSNHYWYVQILDKNESELYRSAEKTVNQTTTPSLSDALALENLSGAVYVRLYIKQNGGNKYFSIPQLLLKGVVKEDTRDTYTITYALGEGTGVLPSEEIVRAGDSYKVSKSYFLTKENSTFTGWKSGENTYAPGQIISPAGDMTLTAQFEANTVSLDASDAATTVSWDFQKQSIGEFNLASGTFVTQATIGGKTLDVPMFFDKQIRNENWTDWAILTSGVTLTIPAVKNMQITMLTYNSPSTSTIAGATDYSVEGTSNPYTVNYTYTGTASTIDLVLNDAEYIRTLSVVYPKTLAAKPTIAVGNFNFSTKTYPVTFTAAEGETLYVSNGSDFAVQTSPYQANVAAGVTCEAKSSVDGGATYSDVESFTNEFDGSNKYVAWVYTKGYGTANYAFATDPMVTALQTEYNVVEVNYAQTETPSTDLNNADLIVCTEAMTGNKTLSNGMKDFAGVTPMIGLKAFNYTNGRWSWGTPANPSSTTNGFTPKSEFYKVLNGVTYETDGTINLATASSGNVVQTVEFGTDGCTAPDGNVIMGTIGDSDAKAVMYASNKYFGLGLSSDCWSTYSANTITIIKNAAAMLIAGEALDATVTSVTATIDPTYGWATFSSPYALDFSNVTGLKAYIATAADDTKVLLERVEGTVAANTGLVIRGETADIPVVASGTDYRIQNKNKLVACSKDENFEELVGATYYVLSVQNGEVVFAEVGNNKPTVKAGHAFLAVPITSPGARAQFLTLSFGNVATGISTVEAQKTVDGEVYNLSGQRVSQPTKGLYIVNGKKVIK